MTYFWAAGYEIVVQTEEDGKPRSIIWDWYEGVHDIWLIVDSWSVDDAWWIERKRRSYYFVVTEKGQALIIFRDELNHTWYIQWLYD